MRRSIVAVAAVVAVLTTGLLPHASAAGPKKPSTKINCGKLLSADPLGCTILGGLYPTLVGGADDHGYGAVSVTITQPPQSDNLTAISVTCTPVKPASALPAYPTGAKTTVYPVSWDDVTGGYVSTNPRFHPIGSDPANPGQVTMWTDAYAGNKAPSVKCKVILTNAGGISEGKEPKLTTGLPANCGILTQENPPLNPSATATPTSPLDGSPTPTSGNLFLKVYVNGVGTFCSTDRTASPKWSTDQQVTFTGGQKVKAKTKFAQLKKFKLVAPVASSIPLTTIGATVVYGFDTRKLQVTGCAVSAAKADGKTNSCSFNNVAAVGDATYQGTITISGDDVAIVKVGKPIISPVLTVDFNYIGTPGTANIWLVSSSTRIDIAGGIDVNVDDTYDCGVTGLTNTQLLDDGTGSGPASTGNAANLCFAGQGHSDPNHNYPIFTFTGLA